MGLPAWVQQEGGQGSLGRLCRAGAIRAESERPGRSLPDLGQAGDEGVQAGVVAGAKAGRTDS